MRRSLGGIIAQQVFGAVPLKNGKVRPHLPFAVALAMPLATPMLMPMPDTVCGGCSATLMRPFAQTVAGFVVGWMCR